MAKKKLGVGNLVVVHWRDHWSNDDDHDPPWADDCVNRSYGEVVRETDDLVSIATTVSESEGMTKYGGVLHIWKALLIGHEDLGPAE